MPTKQLWFNSVLDRFDRFFVRSRIKMKLVMLRSHPGDNKAIAYAV